MPIPSQIAPHDTDRVGKGASKNASTHKLEKGFYMRRVDRRMRCIDFGPFCFDFAAADFDNIFSGAEPCETAPLFSSLENGQFERAGDGEDKD